MESSAAILDAFYKLMATDPAHLPDKIVCAVLCDLFLQFSEKHHSNDTFVNYRHFLQSFCATHGRTPAAEMKPFHVNRWLDANPSWTGGRRHAVIAIRRAFSWADQQGVLSPNPLKGIKADRVKRRNRILTAEEQREILDAIRDKPCKRFFRVLPRPAAARPMSAA